MDDIDFPRFILAFVFVIGLIGLVAVGIRRYKGLTHKMLGLTPSSGRVCVIESHYLDPRRRLVLVRRDRTEHLILLADGRETLLESWAVSDA